MMHATVSGCGDEVFDEDWQVIAAARLLLSYLPDSWQSAPASAQSQPPEQPDWPDGLIPADPNVAYDVRSVISRVVDADTLFEIKARWAQEMMVGFAP